MKLLFLSLGCFSLMCGIVGVVTPILPTTPFVLLSAFCFAKSSERFHAWITTHSRFGPLISRYHTIGVPPRVKIIAIGCASASIGLSLYVIETTALQVLLAGTWAVACITILWLPYRK